jgi:hypothetical protein
MKINVPVEVLAKTIDCPQNLSCLLNDGQCGDPNECKVDYANGENVLFLESKKAIPCPYRINFADGIICRCPTHFYLHKNNLTEL